jgi:hypothetical protein
LPQVVRAIGNSRRDVGLLGLIPAASAYAVKHGALSSAGGKVNIGWAATAGAR